MLKKKSDLHSHTDLMAALLNELGTTASPTPLELSNGQVIKEPYMILAYAEKHALRSMDLEETHGEPPAILRGLKTNLLRVYTTPQHPPNTWVIMMIGKYRCGFFL